MLEVYKKLIQDLLAAPPQPGQTIKKLEIKQVAEGVHHVLELIEVQVHSMSESWALLLEIDSTELLKYKQMVEKDKHEVNSKYGLVKKMEETVQILEAKLKGRNQTNKSLQDKLRELEEELVNERKARLTPEVKVKEQQAENIYEKPPITHSRTVNEANLLSRD
ncbi:hypothetical protein KI387_030555 [Taxus chinensis]|uniref:Uncharacterized protein n=1 Tax=Taxus chinensis TaxID=29808 RepID=A0AA38CHI3_TAXCH|nr:hypothetical protein KI387_030555 [Taxus chinensis]